MVLSALRLFLFFRPCLELTNGRIISGVLSADSSEFRKTADNIEKAKDGPPKKVLARIKDYISQPRSVHDKTRETSLGSPTSIIAVILGEGTGTLTQEQHTMCLEYLSACLAVRDREEITKVLCRHKPDHFTQAIRDVVSSFEPIIRSVHEKIDLREHLTSIESTLTDLINTSKPKANPVTISNIQTGSLDAGDGPTETRAPSIEDYVGLLMRTKQLVYNLIHDVLSKCPEVADGYRGYCKQASKAFSSGQTYPSPQRRRVPREQSSSTSSFVSAVEEIQLEATAKTENSEHVDHDPAGNQIIDPGSSKNNEDHPPRPEWRQRSGAAGALSRNLQTLFSALPCGTRARVLSALDAHVVYLGQLEELSLNRMQHILDDMLSPSQPQANGGSANPSRDSSSSNIMTGNKSASNIVSSLENGSLRIPQSPRGLGPSSRPGSNRSSIAAGTGPSKAEPTATATASISGPGMFLSRWQQLLDDTVVTPDVPGGQPRRGKDVKHALAQGKTVSSAAKGAWDPEELTVLVESGAPVPPEGERVVVDALGAAFKSLVGDLVARTTA